MAQFSGFVRRGSDIPGRVRPGRVRPGLVRVDATNSPVANMFVSVHKKDAKVVLGAVHTNDAEKSATVSLSDADIPSNEKCTTSSITSVAREGTVKGASHTFSVVLGAKTATTLQGNGCACQSDSGRGAQGLPFALFGISALLRRRSGTQGRWFRCARMGGFGRIWTKARLGGCSQVGAIACWDGCVSPSPFKKCSDDGCGSGIFDGSSDEPPLPVILMLRMDPISYASIGDKEPGMPSSVAEEVLPEFPELYRRYFRFVWSCSSRLGVGQLEIDDVVQEIFMVIHGRLNTLERPESLRSWIYGIVRRTVSTYHRAKRTQGASTSALFAESDLQYPRQPSPQDLAEQSDQVKLLWMLLEKLDPPKREVFVLAELDEMTVPEIASALDIPLNTAYSRLRGARRELEEALSRFHAQSSQRGRTCLT